MKDLKRPVVPTRCQKIAIKSNCSDLDNQDEFSLNKIVVTKSSRLKPFDSIKITNSNDQILNDLLQTFQFVSKTDSKLSGNFTSARFY